MFLLQTSAKGMDYARAVRGTEGDGMKTAADLTNEIEEFLTLSNLLELTRCEEQTLLSLEAQEWEPWRSHAIAPNTPASPLLIRRLEYAVALLRRMAAASPATAAWTTPRESRL